MVFINAAPSVFVAVRVVVGQFLVAVAARVAVVIQVARVVAVLLVGNCSSSVSSEISSD